MSLEKLHSKIKDTWPSVFSVRALVIVSCVMVFAVLAGPFGTLVHLSLGERILLWVPLIAISVVLGWVSNLVAQIVLGNRHPALIEALAVFFMTLVFAPCVWFLTMQINPTAIAALGRPEKLVVYVFVVVAAVAAIRYSVIAWRDDLDRPHEKAIERPRLLNRLSKSMRAPVLRISAKDHMVEVVTEQGRSEVRLRLGDAVAEMEPVEGFMAHRSHWVAKSAVIEACRQNQGKMYLRLINGDLVPVSRTCRADWINAGLLEDCTETSIDAASAQPVVQAPSEQQSSPRA